MKKALHPETFENATITCSCGTTYTTESTKEAIQVELCAACHPFYTGTQTIIDTARRVERFQERAAKKEKAASARVGKSAKKAARAKKRQEAGPTVEVEETKTGRVIKKHIRVTKSKKAEKPAPAKKEATESAENADA